MTQKVCLEVWEGWVRAQKSGPNLVPPSDKRHLSTNRSNALSNALVFFKGTFWPLKYRGTKSDSKLREGLIQRLPAK